MMVLWRGISRNGAIVFNEAYNRNSFDPKIKKKKYKGKNGETFKWFWSRIRATKLFFPARRKV